MKIKWNDDRVRGAMTAILLIGRARIARGDSTDLVQMALEEYRADPEGYKENKSAWAPPKDLSPLTKPAQIAAYQNLMSALDRLAKKTEQNRIQFNSLRELDNWLVASLRNLT